MIAALALCRLAQFGATMLIFGASAFVWALVPAKLVPGLTGRIAGRASWLALVAAATSVLWLGLEAAQMSGSWGDALDPGTAGEVLFGTAFGRVWQVHLGLAAAVAVVALFAPGRLGPLALTSAAALGSLGFVGHATMHAGALGWVHRADHTLHLLAAGAWFGSLAPLLAVMRALDDPKLRGASATALRRYSQVGHWVVALVLATGAADTLLVLGGWPVDLASPYIGVLVAKLALVGLMVGVALANRYRLVPQIARSPDAARTWLRRNTLAELALGLFVLGLSSSLSSLDPNEDQGATRTSRSSYPLIRYKATEATQLATKMPMIR